MDSRIIAVPLLLLLCLSLSGCVSTEQPQGSPAKDGRAAGNAVLAKFMENREANRFSDYKAEATIEVNLSIDGRRIGNLTVRSWANVSGNNGHAIFCATMPSPGTNGTVPVALIREYYMAGGQIFSKTHDSWGKNGMPHNFPDTFDSQTEIAVSSIDPTALQTVGEGDVEGIPCYVLKGAWDPEEEVAFASSMGGPAYYAENNRSNFQPMYGNITLWISKDRYALMKHEREACIIIGNRTRFDISETMTYYDLNVTNVITLPESVIGQSTHPA